MHGNKNLITVFEPFRHIEQEEDAIQGTYRLNIVKIGSLQNCTVSIVR